MEIWNYGLAHWSVGLLMSLEIFLVASTHKCGSARGESHAGERVLWEQMCMLCLCFCSKNRHPAVISSHLHVIQNCFHPLYLWTDLYFRSEVQNQMSIGCFVTRRCSYAMNLTWILPELTEWQLKHSYAVHHLSVSHVKQMRFCFWESVHFLLLCGFSVSLSCTSKTYSTFSVSSLVYLFFFTHTH